MTDEPLRRSVEGASPARLRFAQKFKQARRAAGLTQADVMNRSGVQRSTLSDIEQGKHNVTIDMMDRLANAVGYPLAELL
ncbi:MULTISPECIES: helix-turn-helix domain-containing protein [Pseudomonas]|uniref:Putative transcriptional regulator n=1 Tax=Pseudomonas asplenii TaxID=53407 RepID=A0A0N0E2T6_9PSED|nr:MULTISPECIES: helix-turn-helix transcriptional regulator [Pseudomonas]KPA89294.1 putative transcriptional regulator [Pseudomonas fuscovaginae]KPA98473.1 putative transcriptional regulator [Pseudomonas fuscovaginae]